MPGCLRFYIFRGSLFSRHKANTAGIFWAEFVAFLFAPMNLTKPTKLWTSHRALPSDERHLSTLIFLRSQSPPSALGPPLQFFCEGNASGKNNLIFVEIPDKQLDWEQCAKWLPRNQGANVWNCERVGDTWWIRFNPERGSGGNSVGRDAKSRGLKPQRGEESVCDEKKMAKKWGEGKPYHFPPRTKHFWCKPFVNGSFRDKINYGVHVFRKEFFPIWDHANRQQPTPREPHFPNQ